MSRRGLPLLALLIVGALATTLAEGQVPVDDDAPVDTLGGREEHRPKHRFDLSAVSVDGSTFDSAYALVAYTYSVSSNSNISLTVPFLDPDLYLRGDTGFGDLLISFSYVPYLKIDANPWVPKTVGSGIDVLRGNFFDCYRKLN